MKSTTLSRGAIPAAVCTLVLALGACSSDGTASGSAAGTDAGAAASSSGSADPTSSGQPFGPGCAALPTDGPGSPQGMSTAPVAMAAAADPVLSALVQALTAANLVDSLNGQQDVTVLAPANEAFQAVPADQLDALVADVPQLTSVLTHHVLQGRLSPAALAGEQTTLNNDTVTIEGSGKSFTLSGDQTVTGTPASVLCGNIQTANATVYVIDQVLAPRTAG